MKKTIIPIIVVALLIGLFAWGMGTYNKFVTEEEQVSAQWSNVENQYQRRADLIPNLVKTVKGYATHEKETFQAVVEARAKATQMQVNANDLTPEKIEQFQATQGELSSALGRLLLVVENYPELKANQNFLELQTNLERTENRIAVERTRFNESAKNYNVLIRRAPQSIIAVLFGFDKKPYFASQEGADKAPEVEF